ncbi:MAG: HupE/UreJ family protein [Brevundimonas sp.]|uniref:HupE/UreJ family protein n=1 Tax=Brevundimonas sp. TaxID=1871086 RepID=UPI00391F1881
MTSKTTNKFSPAGRERVVLMAGINLAGRTPPVGLGLVLVLGCGLLHGLGFASGLGALPPDASTRLSTLAGFNLGVEVGQLVFPGGVLLAGHLVGRRAPGALRAAASPVASALALVFGLALTVERLVSG